MSDSLLFTRLACNAFLLFVERDLVAAREKNSSDLSTIENLYSDLQFIYNQHLRVEIDYDKVWNDFREHLKGHIFLGTNISHDVDYSISMSRYLEKFYDIENDFLLSEDLREDTVVMIS